MCSRDEYNQQAIIDMTCGNFDMKISHNSYLKKVVHIGIAFISGKSGLVKQYFILIWDIWDSKIQAERNVMLISLFAKPVHRLDSKRS